MIELTLTPGGGASWPVLGRVQLIVSWEGLGFLLCKTTNCYEARENSEKSSKQPQWWELCRWRKNRRSHRTTSGQSRKDLRLPKKKDHRERRGSKPSPTDAEVSATQRRWLHLLLVLKSSRCPLRGCRNRGSRRSPPSVRQHLLHQ